jgi:hypothetical protein
MSEKQLEIVRGNVFGALVGKAGDLRLLHKLRDPKGAIREVAALGRLAFWLEHGQILVPDRTAREVAQGLAEGVDWLNEWEEVVERYEEAMAEHDALHAFVAHFVESGSGEPTAAERGDVSRPVRRRDPNR